TSLKLENECFVGRDNVIAVGKDLREDLERVVALNPDIVVAGNNGCKVNCPECCDKPAYRNRVSRRYCEYLTELGNYCIIKLAGEKGTDGVCERWFCGEFCEDPVDRFSGNPLDVPLIYKPQESYTFGQKQEFVKLAAMIGDKIPVDAVLRESARGREVMLYKSAKSALLKTAEGKAAALIESDRFSEAEHLMGKNPYFDMLKEWEELYCRRKGIRKEE
ncbi:MAG: hypothetical protein QME12_08520, partial [Nanoarchaeota archaeon]|nr:hypothetical protein [Nanoarchaeota archaeon]